jgi:hypothetical protein
MADPATPLRRDVSTKIGENMRTPRLATAASRPLTTLAVATCAALLTTSIPLVAAPPTVQSGAKPSATAPIDPKITVTETYDYPFAKYSLPPGSSTVGRGVSNGGGIAGYVQFGGGRVGFIRNADGTFTPPLVHPADSTNSSTFASGVNRTGTIAGTYLDSNGFVLQSRKFTNSANTQFYAINDLGDTCGSYNGANTVPGIPGLIVSSGSKTTFFAPGATGKAAETRAEAINNLGDVAGPFTTDGKIYSSFYRSASGTMNVITYPKAMQTLVHGLNDHGWLCGHYLDVQNVEHGFVLIEGNYVTYDYPGGIGTSFNSINNMGLISGLYTTANGVWHGLVLKVSK